jgi:hypothetical protein
MPSDFAKSEPPGQVMSRSTCFWRVGARRAHDLAEFLAAESAVGSDRPGSSATVLLRTILIMTWGSGTGSARLAVAPGIPVFNVLLLQSTYSLTFQLRNLPRSRRLHRTNLCD